MVPTTLQQLKASVRINEMFFNQVRPAVMVSPSGSLDTFRPWSGKKFNKKSKAANWMQVQKQTEVLMSDIEKCIECNPDYYVSLAGFNDDEIVDCMYLMHTPSRLYGASCPVPTVPLVDAQDFPNDVY